MKKSTVKYISRRDFLKLTGLATGGITAGTVFLNDDIALSEELVESLTHGKGEETWQNTICRQCEAGCGISVRKIDGVPVYVKGNPIYPVNRGGVCPMAHTSLELLYNPDRIKTPLIRSGSKVHGEFEQKSWEEILSTLSKRINDLIKKGKGNTIAMINGDDSPMMRTLCRHWMKAIGSPNYFEEELLAENSSAVYLTHGLEASPSYDLANSNYILNFGSNFLEEGRSPIYFQNIFEHIRSKVRGERGKLIHIDSRMNLTASSSDKWVPIRPGTYSALALGIAYVLIVERLFDKDFIK